MLDSLTAASGPSAAPPLGQASGWFVLGLVLLLVLGAVALLSTMRQKRLLRRIAQGLARLSNSDFTPIIAEPASEPMASVVRHFNALGAVLRENEESAEHHELLLRTLIDSTPMAILLLVDTGEIEYANQAARDLFFEGRSLEQENFMVLLSEAKAPLRDAVLDVNDCLFTVDVEGTAETYHLAKRHFEIHGRTHTLLTIKHLTRELRRQEIDIWKKLIRVVSHELNNSLAPIMSLAHSARTMTKSEQNPKLERVFCTIEERAQHLQQFVEGYARFARLPNPRRAQVNVTEFAQHLQTLAPYARVEVATATPIAYFDRLQLEQVMINLLKNAQEAGGAEDQIALTISVEKSGVTTFLVTDRGPGMSEQVLENATLPFYSTKERGSGLGLALCREIVEAHGGTIKLENREGGGLAVTSILPGFEVQPASAPAKLTLSRL